MVPTSGFVYRFEWNDPELPSGDSAEATAELIAGDRERFFTVPDHFIDFIKATTVK
jgi:hypothetical protein